MSWAIEDVDAGNMVGYPQPLVFATRKEARARMSRLSAQLRGAWSLRVVATPLPANCTERIHHYRRGRRRGAL